MSDSSARKRPTYADIEALPPHLRGEILGGELVVSPRPGPPHAKAATTLSSGLDGFNWDSDGPGGWWILVEPELHLEVDDDYPIVVPDLAGWRVETMPHLPLTAAFTLVPDWICEVLSPSTMADDRVLKLPFYARAGVSHAWLVDPLLFTLEVYRREGPHWILVATHSGEAPVRAEPFEAIELPLARLWGGRKPPPGSCHRGDSAGIAVAGP